MIKSKLLPVAFVLALSVPVMGMPPEVPAVPTVVPEGKGSVDDAGKFAPPPSAPAEKAASLPPVDRAAAEGDLKKALKIEEPAPGVFRIGLVSFSKADRTVKIPAKVNMREGVVEYLLTTETGKAHETVLTTKAAPQDFHTACLLLGVAADAPVEITATWETNGPAAVVPVASLIRLKDQTELPGAPWPYAGSLFTPQGKFAAQEEGSFVSLISDSHALVTNPGPSRTRDDAHVANTDKLPRAGLPITLVFKFQPIPSSP